MLQEFTIEIFYIHNIDICHVCIELVYIPKILLTVSWNVLSGNIYFLAFFKEQRADTMVSWDLSIYKAKSIPHNSTYIMIILVQITEL